MSADDSDGGRAQRRPTRRGGTRRRTDPQPPRGRSARIEPPCEVCRYPLVPADNRICPRCIDEGRTDRQGNPIDQEDPTP